MHRGTSIAHKPGGGSPPPTAQVEEERPSRSRILSTEEANAFLGRRPGFLEKRRSSGIDSPEYIQRVPGGAVRYREDALIKWEDERTRRSTSER